MENTKMKNLYIDIETYSTADLKKYGAVHYARHVYTEILVVAWALNDEKAKSYLPKEQDTPEELLKLLNNPTVTLIAHNAQFEHAVFNYVATRAPMRWPRLHISRFNCTMAIANTLNIPADLAGLGSYLDLPQQKYAAGKKLIDMFCKPDKKGIRTNMIDHPVDALRFMRYCEMDVEATRAAHKALPIKSLSPVEQQTWELDAKINNTGVPIDLPLVNAAADMVAEYTKTETAKFEKIFGFRPTQNAKLLTFLNEQGVDIADTQKSTLEGLTDLPALAQQAIDIRLGTSKASVKKFAVMRNAAVGNRIYGCFKYAMAGPGRWSSKIVQFQNMARPTIDNPETIEKAVYSGLPSLELMYKHPLEALASILRYVIYSSHGLNIIDFSSIEARVLAWIAGQDDVLQVFRDGTDLYKHTAAKMFNVAVDKVTAAQRFLGKIATLALGYQGGKAAFARMAKAFGVEIPEDKAEKIKLDWREANKKIVELWRYVEQTAIQTVKDGKTRQLGKLEFGVHKTWFYIKLPSGRTINYADPKLIKSPTPWGDVVDKLTYYGQDSKTKQWCRIDTYGGKLVENVCQAIARDLLRDALLRLDSAGYNIILHIHDEAVVEANNKFRNVKQIFTYTPTWATGLPIDSSGTFSHHYGK